MTAETQTPDASIYGLMAEFEHPDDLVAAAKQVHAAGYTKTDAFTPYPIEEISEALHLKRSHVPKIVFAGGLIGAMTGFLLQVWVNLIVYPMNIGGRPNYSWPAFIIPTFETTILFASLSAVVGMIALNGLPQPYHPVFNVPGFALASRNRFFLLVEAEDPRFDRQATAAFLSNLNPSEVAEVAH
jgi:Protein of unknown function (DUF3341)